MNRRTLLAAVAGSGVLLAGCTGTGSDEETTAEVSGDDADENGDDADENGDNANGNGDDADEELTTSELVDLFESGLEERGFERVAVDAVDDRLELGYDATGTTEDDVATEIELITDEYTTVVESGLSVARLEATAYEPATDTVLDYFEIETEWVEAYLSENLEWSELLGRIGETFVSVEPTDDGEDGAEDEAEDEETGDDSQDDTGDDSQDGAGEDSQDDTDTGSDEDGADETETDDGEEQNDG